MEDYYSLLGVSKNATQDDIKKAYRNQAFKYHPDRNQGDKAAEEMFKKISEAYSVLGDESKRRQYDMYGSSSQSSQSSYQSQQSYANGTYGYNPFDQGYAQNQDDPFWEFFNEGGYSSQSQRRSQNENRRYEYTYTSRNTERPTRSQAWAGVFSGLGQFVLSLLGMGIFGSFIPLVGLLCLVTGIKGLLTAIRSFGNLISRKTK